MSLESAKYECLNLNSIKIHTVSMGSDNKKTPILLLHGFPEFYYSYRYLMPLLANDRKVVAIDQRGYNKSSKPKRVKNYRLEHLMSDVVGVIKKISDSKKVILVGHDWGGAVAWHVARCYPKQVEKLIILNCPPADLLFNAMIKIPRQLIMSYYIFFFQLPLIPERFFRLNNFKMLRIMQKSIKTEKGMVSNEEIKEYIKCFNQPRGLSGINYYRAAFRDAMRGRLDPKRKVQCPTLVLWGTKDFALHTNLTLYFKEYVHQKKDLRIKYFKGVGHFTPEEIPTKIAEEILDFV
jgi:pimeloyl-ACP methyl ester carboxylesterase